jgi:Holliday junction resolvase
MKPFHEIKDTGEWWLQEGWEMDTILEQKRYSPEEIISGIETLKPIFNADWFKDILGTPVRNIVAAELIYIGPKSYDFLIELSQMIRSLNKAEGFRPVCERLKSIESDSAFFEIQIAHIFQKSGVKVEFPKREKSKTPDVIAYFPDKPIAIECKYLNKEKWEIWMEELHSKVHSAVSFATPKRKFKIQLHIDPRLSDIHFDDEKEPVINSAIESAIVTNIKEIVDKMLESNVLPVNFEVAGLVSGTIFAPDADVQEETSGAQISTSV